MEQATYPVQFSVDYPDRSTGWPHSSRLYVKKRAR